MRSETTDGTGTGARRLAAAALFAAAWLVLSPAGPDCLAAVETPQEKAQSGLMCFCGCSDLTVRACSCGVAAEIKKDIADRMATGQTVDQVLAAYVGRYGEQILSAPTREGFNLLAWIVPFATIAGAGLLVVALVRRWGGRRHPAPAIPGAAQAAPGPPVGASDRALLDRIEREMRKDF